MLARRWLIVADDLTGAADSAVAFAKGGARAAVTWVGRAIDPQIEIISVDTGSRQLPAARAAIEAQRGVLSWLQPDRALYKKIDSTIRGHPAAEIAAMMAQLRHNGKQALALVAPAFPAMGRSVEDGSIRIEGQPLEATSLWARDHTYPHAFLPEILESTGLRCALAPLAIVRRGAADLADFMVQAGRDQLDAIVCDSVLDADLASIAAAGKSVSRRVVWTGSGGLAAALVTPRRSIEQRLPKPARTGGILIVVGSMAHASRASARRLAVSGEVRHMTLQPALLMEGAGGQTWSDVAETVVSTLAAHDDVLVEIGMDRSAEAHDGGRLAVACAELLRPATDTMGGLVVTGGEMARSLLDWMGAEGIRLYDQVGPGLPIGFTTDAAAIPIVTKAGAFGDEDSLARCLFRLRQILKKGF